MDSHSEKEVNTLSSNLFGLAASTATYPFAYARVLIQFGHEPLEPVLKKKFGLFGDKVPYYPSIFAYVGHIRREDGFLGLFRGLGWKLSSAFICSTISDSMKEHFKTQHQEKRDENQPPTLNQFLIETSHDTIANCVGLIASQPFQVIMLRSMAQFVGGETKYSGIFAPIQEIYNEQGILGFFSGLVPRLVAEILAVWITNSIIVVLNKYLEDKNVKMYIPVVWRLFVSSRLYPLQLTSNIMAVQGSGLLASVQPHMNQYGSWTECLGDLWRVGEHMRGSNVVFGRRVNLKLQKHYY